MSSRITSPTPCSGEQTLPPQFALVVHEFPTLPPLAQNLAPGPVHAMIVYGLALAGLTQGSKLGLALRRKASVRWKLTVRPLTGAHVRLP
jgi:hypothetical protein